VEVTLGIMTSGTPCGLPHPSWANKNAP